MSSLKSLTRRAVAGVVTAAAMLSSQIAYSFACDTGTMADGRLYAVAIEPSGVSPGFWAAVTDSNYRYYSGAVSRGTSGSSVVYSGRGFMLTIDYSFPGEPTSGHLTVSTPDLRLRAPVYCD